MNSRNAAAKQKSAGYFASIRTAADILSAVRDKARGEFYVATQPAREARLAAVIAAAEIYRAAVPRDADDWDASVAAAEIYRAAVRAANESLDAVAQAAEKACTAAGKPAYKAFNAALAAR